MSFMIDALGGVGFCVGFHLEKIQDAVMTKIRWNQYSSSRDDHHLFITPTNQYLNPMKSLMFHGKKTEISANSQMRVNAYTCVELPLGGVGFVSDEIRPTLPFIKHQRNNLSDQHKTGDLGRFMAGKNSWFKHYNTASDGCSMELLWAEQDYETIAFFWRINEWVSKFEDENNRGTCQLSLSLLRRKLGWNRSRSVRVLSKISSRFKMNCELHSDGETVLVSVPNWLELQENRGGKREAKPEQKPDRGRGRRKKREGEVDFAQNEFPPSELFVLWNQHRGSLAEAVKLTKKRAARASKLWKENPNEQHWIKIIQKIATSPFCNGENKRHWKATFDFLLQDDTETKVLEGTYTSHKPAPRAQVFIP